MDRTRALSLYLKEVKRRPFAYGQNDCLLMVAGAVERMTGIDHARTYRGRYSSLAGARRLLGMSLLKFVGSLFEELEHQSRAVDGDIGAVKQGREWTFGVFSGAFIYLQMTDGIGLLPRSVAGKAFRVP